MSKTQQEKMNEIYELTGVEPDYIQRCDGGTLVPWEERDEVDLDWKYFDRHYTESKLWEMLPEEIRVKEHVRPLFLIIVRNCVRYLAYSYSPQGMYKETRGNLHEALVDMVLWCIDQGHIKKKGEV